MTDQPVDESRLEEAERRGFTRGLNVGLVTVSVLVALGVGLRSLYDLPRFEAVFRQVKVPLPGLTLLVLNCYQVMAAILLIGAIGCILATRYRGYQRRTIVLNVVVFLLSLAWSALYSVGAFLPLMSLFHHDGIGSPR